MSLLDGLLGQAKNIDLSALAGQLGLSPEELKTGGEAMLSKLAGGGVDAEGAAAHAAAETGIDLSKLQGLMPALASQFGEVDFNGILSKIGIGGGADGILGKVGGMLDRDGDGNPINDIAGFAKGLFGKS
jgi:hypothetical protein